MNRRLIRGLISGAAVCGAAACSDTTAPSLLSDSQIATDVATTSGSAIANDVQYLLGSETGGAFPAPPALGSPPVITPTRTRTCYDANDAVQATCDPNTTAKVVVQITVNGSFTDTTFNGVFSASIHRSRTETITNLLGAETFRLHNAVGTGNDTTHFSGSRGTRDATESSVDSVVDLKFNLPHSSNPWPASGMIIRNVTGTVTLTGANQSGSRSYTRRVTVTFPADNQGNVVLQINDKTCNLNLVTRRVTSCS